MISKSPNTVIMDAGLAASLDVEKRKLGRAAASEFSKSVRKGKSNFADLLSQLYDHVQQTIDELPALPTVQRAQALTHISKVIPALQQAEKNARTHIKHRAVEELSSSELKAQVMKYLGKGVTSFDAPNDSTGLSDSPMGEDAGDDSTNPVKK